MLAMRGLVWPLAGQNLHHVAVTDERTTLLLTNTERRDRAVAHPAAQGT